MNSQPNNDTLALHTVLVIFAARLVRALRRASVTPAGARVLSLLDEHGPLGVTQLAKLDRCSQPTMSAAGAPPAAGGLVVKGPTRMDARGSVVSLTGEGADSLAGMRDGWATTIVERLRAHDRT